MNNVNFNKLRIIGRNKNEVKNCLHSIFKNISDKDLINFNELMDICNMNKTKVNFLFDLHKPSGIFSSKQNLILLNLHKYNQKRPFKRDCQSLDVLISVFAHEIGHSLDPKEYSNYWSNYQEYCVSEKMAWNYGFRTIVFKKKKYYYLKRKFLKLSKRYFNIM